LENPNSVSVIIDPKFPCEKNTENLSYPLIFGSVGGAFIVVVIAIILGCLWFKTRKDSFEKQLGKIKIVATN
jgi:hypothetical protein